MANTKICRFCGDEFVLRPGKPGLIDVCEEPVCIRKGEKVRWDPGKWMAGVSWLNKHTPVIEIMRPRAARAFNGVQRRFGASVMKSIVEAREPHGFAAIEE